jgi:broad specificity phosphatase PhoE
LDGKLARPPERPGLLHNYRKTGRLPPIYLMFIECSAVISTRLTLICHARTVAQKLARFPTNEPVENQPLKLGALATQFANASLLLCGPELRTRQTAEWFGAAPQVDAALRDCDWGRWHGQAIKDLQVHEADALQAWISDPQAAPHGGESVMQLGERVARWLTSLQGMPGHIVAITHPFVVRAALMQVMQGAAFNAVDVEPLSVVELRFNGIWRLRLPGIDLAGAL